MAVGVRGANMAPDTLDSILVPLLTRCVTSVELFYLSVPQSHLQNRDMIVPTILQDLCEDCLS